MDIKSTYEEVVKQNEFLQAVIESLPYPFYVIDARSHEIMVANSKTAHNDGWKGSTCHALTHHRATPCDAKEHSCPLEEVKKTRKPVVLEHIHYDAEGNKRNVEIHGYPIFDDRGELIQMIEYCIDITSRKSLEEEREKLVADLQEVLAKVKLLSGFIPICASCKNIRDDKGYWKQIEAYISDHSEAEFSHSICPECARRLYPDIDWEKKKSP